MVRLRNWLLVIGILLIALGAIPWIGSKKTPIYDVKHLIPMLWGWSAIVMSWSLPPHRMSIRGCRALLLLGIAMAIGGWQMWEFDRRDPVYKLNLFAFPIVPGCFLAMLGWIALIGARRESDRKQSEYRPSERARK